MKFVKPMMLRAEIAKEKSPKRLAALLEENNIAKIGVHIFYPDNSDRGQIENTRILYSQKYDAYAKDVTRFISSWQRVEDCMFLLEDFNGSRSKTNEILEMNGSKFEIPKISYYSHDGAVYKYAQLTARQGSRERAYAANNIAAGSFASLVEIVKKSHGVFLFGLYESMCVANARSGIRRMLSELEMRVGVYKNSMLTKNPWEF